MIAVVALAGALLSMLLELRISQRHERWLVAQGALAAPDPVYPVMRWAYPGAFVLMAAEGLVAAPPRGLAIAGLALFLLAKLLKGWAIRTLGRRWTYRVFVLPGAPLIRSGPYRWLRHPNYVGVVGELVGFALLVGAPVAGVVAVAGFGAILWRRIRAEEHALGLSRGRDRPV